MNAKSKLSVKYAEGVIEMNTTFAKMMQNPLSEEYALLQKTRQDFPTFAIRRRQIKSNPQKDTYKGLTYKRMKEYITKYSEGEEQEKNLAELEKMIDISKCHGQALRYPTIKKWFLAKYPEVAKFGLVTADQEENEEETAKPQERLHLTSKNAEENTPVELDDVV